MLRGITQVVRRFNLPVEDESRLLQDLEQAVEGKGKARETSEVKGKARETSGETESVDETSRVRQHRHGKDQETRLREAGLSGREGNAGGDRDNREDSPGDEPNEEQQAGESPAGQRRVTVAGAPDGGDDDGDDSSEGGDGGRRSPIEPRGRAPRRRPSVEDEEDDDEYGFGGRRREHTSRRSGRYSQRVDSASAARPITAALPLVHNASDFIMDVLRKILREDPTDLTSLSKNLKPSAPAVYSGEDDIDKFYEWLQNIVRYYWILRLVGRRNDEAEPWYKV